MISRRHVYSLLMVPLLCLAGSPLRAELEVNPESVAKIADALPDGPVVKPEKPRNVLIYTTTYGFRHASIPTGVKAFQMLGEKTRAFTAVHSEDPSMFDKDKLAQFDAVIMLNTTGDCLRPRGRGELTEEEQATLEQRKQNLHDFVAGGRGLLGVHSASDTFYSWKSYGDMIGGWFTGHPWHTTVPMKIDSPNHPLTAMFDAEKGFVIKDEIYQFAPRNPQSSFGGYQPYSRENLRILMSLDTDRFDVSKGARSDNDYAISWIRRFGDGRVFYSVLGHNDFIFWNPVVLQHYLAGLQFVIGDLPADTTPSGGARSVTTVEPFDGKSLSGWKLKYDEGSHWVVAEAKLDPQNPRRLIADSGSGDLVNAEGRGVDIYTEQEFGDCLLEIEVMVPRGSNSGIYLQGNYEVQVLDSYGRDEVRASDIGGIYGAQAPRVNASKPPGEWQKFVIDFQAPRFDGEKKVSNAIFKRVELNGQVLHENVEVQGVTGGSLGRGESPTGPLLFQGDHGPVAYRNIRLTVPE